jgi:hypothetical protein
VVTHSHLTDADFHAEFTDAEECFLAAFDHGVQLIEAAATAPAATKRGWLSRVRAALEGVLRFLDSEPQWAQLLVLETPLMGVAALEHREHAFTAAAEQLDKASPRSETKALPRELLAELVVGGVFSVIHARMLEQRGEQRAERLIELAPSLISMIALHYLGADAAKAELARASEPNPRTRQPQPVPGGTRATYRTALVLRAIGAAPHCSNRDIAATAGLSDEGQTSRLLARLRRQGLIENVGLGAIRGEPNAWLLTLDGRRMAEVAMRDFALEGVQPAISSPMGRVACQG